MGFLGMTAPGTCFMRLFSNQVRKNFIKEIKPLQLEVSQEIMWGH